MFQGGKNISSVSTDLNGEFLLLERLNEYNSIFSNEADSDVLERGILYRTVLATKLLSVSRVFCVRDGQLLRKAYWQNIFSIFFLCNKNLGSPPCLTYIIYSTPGSIFHITNHNQEYWLVSTLMSIWYISLDGWDAWWSWMRDYFWCLELKLKSVNVKTGGNSLMANKGKFPLQWLSGVGQGFSGKTNAILLAVYIRPCLHCVLKCVSGDRITSGQRKM